MKAPPPSALRLANRIVALAREKKARQIRALEVGERVSYADVMILMSSTSDRHTRALADHLQEELKKEKTRPFGIEGQESGKWILLDYGEVVVHIMQKEAREHYDLDGLWQDAGELELPPGED